MSAAKGTAFAAIPDVIQKGRVISTERSKKSADADVYMIAAPIQIAKENYVGVALVRRDANTQKLYLHEAVATKKLQGIAFNTGAPTEAGERTGAKPGAIRNVLQAIFSVKYE